MLDVVAEKVLAKVRALVEGTFESYLVQECGIGAEPEAQVVRGLGRYHQTPPATLR
jgi:hypothetical protein